MKVGPRAAAAELFGLDVADVPEPPTDFYRLGMMDERARCRAIVLRLFANDWKGNQALAEIDSPGVP